MQQVALLQAAVALSASLGRVMSSTKGQLRHKLWDVWGTNRTVTVWQTMEVLSDKLTSRCVTSYLCALVTSKTNSYATSRSLTSCSCLVSKSWTRSVINQRATASQAMGCLRHKQNSHCVTNYGGTIRQTNYLCALVTSKINSYATSRFITSCSCLVSKSWTRYVINQRATASQAMGWLRHKQNSHCVTNYRIGDKQNKLLCNKSL